MIATKELVVNNEEPNQLEIIRKKKLIRREEPTPEDILDGVSMLNSTLLNLVSDNNNIMYYTKLEKGVYSCRHNGYRFVLKINNYNENDATCKSVMISKTGYGTNKCEEALAYLENNELKIEKR